ncbi:MAG: branched-chain amino acid ABC transporter permease [Bacillota bacterium]|nr:branched-chain amino acid ABC transporter permease [Bacillota bacterium]
MTFWVVQLLNGLAFSSLLFLLSVGFTLIFGLMRILKLTHGAFFALGGYVGLTVLQVTGNFYLAILAGGAAMTIIGLLQHKILLHRFHGIPLNQVLLTLGLWLIYDDIILVIWGGIPQRVPPPPLLEGAMSVFGTAFPKYRFALILLGVVVAIVVWLIIEKTKLGAVIRAGADNEEIARAMGINVNKVFIFAFGFGSFLAGIAGVLGAPLLGLEPATSSLILPLALVVVIVGGLGSLKGAMVGSLFVGLVDNFGRVLIPDFAYFTLFAPMALILIFRPQGMFGRK